MAAVAVLAAVGAAEGAGVSSSSGVGEALAAEGTGSEVFAAWRGEGDGKLQDAIESIIRKREKLRCIASRL